MRTLVTVLTPVSYREKLKPKFTTRGMISRSKLLTFPSLTGMFLWFLHMLVMPICQPNEVKNGMSCISTCPKTKYLYLQTCVDTCPQNTQEVITDLSKACSLAGKNFNLAQLCGEDFPYFYNMNCLKKCPDYTTEYNRTCHLQCPREAKLVTAINSTEMEMIGHKTCSEKCPLSHPFTLRTKNMERCVKTCPDFTEVSWEEMECKLQCSGDKPFLFNRTCYTDCPVSHKYKRLSYTDYNSMFICVQECPKQTVYDDDRCVDACPEEKYLYNNTCVSHCPESSPLLYPKYESSSINFRQDIVNYGGASYMCVENCNPKGLPTDKEEENKSKHYWKSQRQYHLVSGHICTPKCNPDSRFEFNGTCLTSCPDNYSFYKPLYRSKMCVKECEKNTYKFNNSCVDVCPEHARFINNVSCESSCSGDLPYYTQTSGTWMISQSGYELKTCISDCPLNYFYLNDSICVNICPKEQNFIFNKTCVQGCPLHFNYKINLGSHYKCVDMCSSKLSFESVCVDECPEKAKFRVNNTCHDQCNEEYPYRDIVYYSKKVKKDYWGQYIYTQAKRYYCVKSCPPHKFKYNGTDCVLQCPKDKNYASKDKCLEKCPDHQELKIWKGSFYKCVNKCETVLVFNKTCLNMCPKEASFEFNGTCVSDCPVDNPYQYDNGTGYCLDRCPSGLHSLNFTCLSRCPNTTFIFNNTCLFDCPVDYQTNYTMNSKGAGIYSCVSQCPENTVTFNGTCYDTCPESLNSHMSVCIAECPSSHQYINLQTKRCVTECPDNHVVSHDNTCISSCSETFPYIEGNKCVRRCHRTDSLHAVTPTGMKCYDSCPHHLLLKENSSLCIDQCPQDMLIVDSVCRKIEACPYHTFIEHSGIGRRCTNKCSKSFYLDGMKCVSECPKEKVIAEMNCFDKCPDDWPLSYKHFSYLSPRVHCYKVCPSEYLANGTTCVNDYDCSYAYDHVCYNECPTATVISDNKSCESNVKYIVYAVSSGVAGLVLLVVFYFLTWFTGMSQYTDSDEDLDDSSYTKPYQPKIVVSNRLSNRVYSKKFRELLETDEIRQLLNEIYDDSKTERGHDDIEK